MTNPEHEPPLPCERYPECRADCTWPACAEPEPDDSFDSAAGWTRMVENL